VSREVARHGGRSEYRASEADSEAWESALRPKHRLLAVHEQLREIVHTVQNLVGYLEK
jgi:IS30 family transposase